MIFRTLRNVLSGWFTRTVQQIEQRFKRRLEPADTNLLLGIVTDVKRSKSELIAENAFLRQQLIVLRGQTQRTILTSRDRGLLVLLASGLRTWKEALFIVKPAMLLHGHRQSFRLFWQHKSTPKARQPRVPRVVITLIHSMALDNRLLGTKRIRDERRKLGFHLSKRTVAKYIRQVRPARPLRQRGQTWTTFLSNHAQDIWACNFLQIYNLWFRAVFVFFIVELNSRRVVHFAVTCSRSDVWVVQQPREATPLDTRPRFLIRDNDSKYGVEFARAASAIEVLRTPSHSCAQSECSL